MDFLTAAFLVAVVVGLAMIISGAKSRAKPSDSRSIPALPGRPQAFRSPRSNPAPPTVTTTSACVTASSNVRATPSGGIAMRSDLTRETRGVGVGASEGVQATRAQAARWIPANESITIAGHRIDGGMLYVGRGMTDARGYGSPEPALIDPTLPVGPRDAAQGAEEMGYWPSYASIPAGWRAAYLEWLAGGRCDPQADIGLVFLFFYGIERRILIDTRVAEAVVGEVPALVSEVRRLLQLYGRNRSFRTYACGFLDLCSGLFPQLDIAAADLGADQVAGDVPLDLRVRVARCAVEKRPIAPELAHAWLLADPENCLRTPASRCPREFKQLFEIRYARQFGEGMTLKPNKTSIRIRYRPASGSFAGQEIVAANENLPDLTTLAAPIGKLRDLADRCCEDLDPYSRWIGRNEGRENSVAAAALLPAELLDNVQNEPLRAPPTTIDDSISPSPTSGPPPFSWRALLSAIDGAIASRSRAVIDADLVLESWPAQTPGKLERAEATMLAQLLAKRGMGIEPDVRFGGPVLKPGSKAVVFRIPPSAPASPSPGYAAAAAVLRLSALVSTADGGVTESEKQALEAHLEASMVLTREERLRLSAHLDWLLTESPGLTGVKRRLGALGEASRRSVAQFAVSIAAADGRIDPREIEALAKIYRALSIPEADLFSSVHAISGRGAPAHEPVTIRSADSRAMGFAIPAPPTNATEQKRDGVELDLQRIDAKLKESKSVAALLGTIFIEDESPVPSPIPELDATALRVRGLDSQYTPFFAELLQRDSWSRVDLESLAERHSVLVDGAIDAINEVALDTTDEMLCEGDDPVLVSAAVAKEMTQ